MASNDVLAWKKRFKSKRGTLYLISSRPSDNWGTRLHPERYENSITYYIMWREHTPKHGMVAKYGYMWDYMSCRYGLHTLCVLAGETPFDFKYGTCTPEIFNTLKKVYKNEVDGLPTFELDTLKGLEW